MTIRPAFLSSALAFLCLLLSRPGAAPVRVREGTAPPAEDAPLIEDFETYDNYEAWTVAGGPEASVLHDRAISRSGQYSLRFRVEVDYTAAGNPAYPRGWLFLRRTFETARDWSAYKALEFYLHVPADHPLRGTILKYGLRAAGGSPRMVWKTISAETIRPGEWTRIVLPLRRTNLNGAASKITQIRFYVAENWYEDGDVLDFRIDDISLLKDFAEQGESEWIRRAGVPLETPDAYLTHTEAILYPAFPLEFIYPDTDLSARTPLEGLTLRLAQGETGTLTFAVVAGNTPIEDLTGQIGDLTGPGGTIPGPSSVDLRVVKVWEQAALHWEAFGPEDRILVPELLLKDDRIGFAESRDDQGVYQAPHILNVPFGTDVPARGVKQIWLTVKLPETIPDGVYDGLLTLRTKQGLARRAVPLRITVLPFTLPPPRHLYGIYYRWRPWSRGRSAIPEDRFRADLAALNQAGFNSVTVGNPDQLARWVDAVRAAGMTGPLVIMGGRQEASAAAALRICRAARLEGYFYGIDEPNGEEKLQRHKELSALLHKAGGKVMTAILPETARKLKQGGEGLDWANHSIQNGHAAAYIRELRQRKTGRTAPFETYYWQVYEENPTRNRLLCGFYLWTSGLDGAFPYEYQSPPSALPYTTDARQSMHNVKPGAGPRTFRAWYLTYPSLEGPVSTLQWEGCRQGIDDTRYLVLLEDLLGRARRAGRQARANAAQAEMERILSSFARLPDDPSVHTNPYVAPARFKTARERIVDLAIELHALGQ